MGMSCGNCEYLRGYIDGYAVCRIADGYGTVTGPQYCPKNLKKTVHTVPLQSIPSLDLKKTIELEKLDI